MSIGLAFLELERLLTINFRQVLLDSTLYIYIDISQKEERKNWYLHFAQYTNDTIDTCRLPVSVK